MYEKLTASRIRFYAVLALLALLMAAAVPTFAQETVTLDVDANQFISAINIWLPVAIGVVVIGVGIKGAFALAAKVGDMITDSFR